MAEGFQDDAFQDDAFQMDVGPPAPPVPPSTVPNVPTPRSLVGGAMLDQLLDPITRDYVDNDDTSSPECGGWLETADSRTIVFAMFELHLGRSYSAPNDGTIIGEAFENGETITPELVEAEAKRVAALLERDGVLTDFSIAIKDPSKPANDPNPYYLDSDGRLSPILRWTDRATGSPVEVQYAPFVGT